MTTETRVVPFTAGDGVRCELLHVREPGVSPTRGPVLLVHGAGVRANIFRAPVQTTLVDYLLARGHDVWLENWRASIDLPPREWTLDDAALFDHPKAVEAIQAETGASRVGAVIHCQGSTSFMMSAVAGLLPSVDRIVTNAVSLHPVVPGLASVKLRWAVPAVGRFMPYLNPQWGLHAPDLRSKLLTAVVRATHHECDNIVCKYASFTYGVGFPTLWRHENLDAATHEWVKGEFASVPMTFFKQMGTCVKRGRMVSVRGNPKLPADFTAQAPKTDARVTFLAGELNRCFLPASQRRSHAFMSRYAPGRHSLTILPRYGHLDVFMGARAARDIFPQIAQELEK